MKNMQNETRYELTCEKCGHKSGFPIYRMIDIDHEPALKRKVLDRTIFIARCNHCGYQQAFPYTTTYIDRKNGLMINFCADEEEYRKVLKLEQNNPMVSRMFDSMRKNSKVRVVRTPMELAEKVAIREKHYDDRIMELMKAALMSNLLPMMPDLSGILFLLDGREPYLLLVKKDYSSGRIPFESRMYADTAAVFNKGIKEMKDELLTVDHNWAERYLSGMKFEEPKEAVSIGGINEE